MGKTKESPLDGRLNELRVMHAEFHDYAHDLEKGDPGPGDLSQKFRQAADAIHGAIKLLEEAKKLDQ